MFHIILNPTAGRGNAARARAEVEKTLSAHEIDYEIHPTNAPHDGMRIARALTEAGAQNIVAMGGDGTLNEVLNGIVDPGSVRLGLIPCGSGNDFAQAASIPTDIKAAVAILCGEAKYTDYMECSGVRGINAIGTGVDVDILRRYASMKLLRGKAAYLASVIVTLIGYTPYAFDEITQHGREPHRSFLACAGNGQSYGGGIPICPKACIDDGLLDVVIVDDIKKPAIPRAFLMLMQRRILEHKRTHFARQDRLCVTSGGRMPIQIDGEIYEDLPFDVKIVHGKLRMHRP